MNDARTAAGPATRSGVRGRRRWASRLIVATGLAWVVYVAIRDSAALRRDFRLDSVSWLLASLAVGLLALLLTVPAYRVLLGHYAGARIRSSFAARTLFVAQILRHLPGRIWGIVYLVKTTVAEIPGTATVRANVDFMLYAMAFNLVVAGSLAIAVLAAPAVAVVAALAAVAAIVAAMRLDWAGTLAKRLAVMLPERPRRVLDLLAPSARPRWSDILTITAAFVCSWACYLLVWWMLPRIFVALADVDIWLLCASYSLAWVLGYLSMVTPGGLGVREAGFVLFASALSDPASLTFLAVFIRLWQLAVEFVLFLAFAFVRPAAPFANIAAGTDRAEHPLRDR